MTEVLPSGWARALIDNLVSEGGLFSDGDWVESKDQDPDGEVRLIQLADVGVGKFRDRSNRFLTSTKAAELNCTYLEPQDVLVARMPDPLGRACRFPGGFGPCVTVVDVAVLRPGQESVDPAWLMWSINSPQCSSQVAALQSGTTRKRISRRNLATIQLTVPPLEEQRRIVAAIEEHFSRLDDVETSLGVALQRLDVLRSAVLNDAFHIHRNLPLAWRASTIGDVADVQLGRQRSPQHHTGEQMRPYLRSANVTWNGISLNDVKAMNFDDTDFKKYRLEPGDLLLNEASGSPNEVGKPAIWDGEISDCCFQNTLLRLRPHGVTLDYLYWFCYASARSGRFGEAGRGVNIRHLGKQGLAQFPISVAPRDEQDQIIERIDRALAQTAASERSICASLTRVAALRRVVLAEAFAGRLVPQDPGDEPASLLLDRIAKSRPMKPPRQKVST